MLSGSAEVRLHELHVQRRRFRCLLLRLFLLLLLLLLLLRLFECPLALALSFEELVRWALHALEHVLLTRLLVLVLTLGARRSQLLPEGGHALVARSQFSHDAHCIGC